MSEKQVEFKWGNRHDRNRHNRRNRHSCLLVDQQKEGKVLSRSAKAIKTAKTVMKATPLNSTPFSSNQEEAILLPSVAIEMGSVSRCFQKCRSKVDVTLLSRPSFPAAGPPDPRPDFYAPGSPTHHRFQHLLGRFSKGSRRRFGGGGGMGPTPSTSAPPRQRSASYQDVGIVYGEFSCLFGWYLQFCLPLVWVVKAVIQVSSDRLRVGPNFLGKELIVRHDASSCATGGASRGGGVLGPLCTTVPRGVSSESAGRPMGPATLL